VPGPTSKAEPVLDPAPQPPGLVEAVATPVRQGVVAPATAALDTSPL
jgi:hypothetical protein